MWRRFSRAQTGQHQDPLAACLDRQSGHFVPDVLGQSGAGVIHDPQPAEKMFAQIRLAPQVWDQRLEPFRHVQVNRGRDLAQISDAFLEMSRSWLSMVDIQRPSVVEN